MADQILKREAIEALHSRYRFVPFEAETSPRLLSLEHSIATEGVLTPLIVHDFAGTYQLIDGFKRLACAMRLGLAKLPCRILPETTPTASVLELLLHEQRNFITSSAAGQARFIRLAKDLGLEETTLIQRFLPALNLQAHPRVLEQLLAVSSLPEEVLTLCEQKHFSLKRCVHLTKHPPEWLVEFFGWTDRLAITASVLEELLDRFKETLRIEQIPLDELLKAPELKAILEAETSSQERTQRLRAWIRARRFPRLTEIEDRMRHTCETMGLPSGVTLHWDPSLERRGLELRIGLTEPDQWGPRLEALGEESILVGIKQLFEDL